MADKSVITNIEARVRQLIDDHKRLSDLCAELTAQRDTLRSEKRTLEERVRELDAELARMQLTEGLAGGGRNREKARARVNRLMREVDDEDLRQLEKIGTEIDAYLNDPKK